MKKIDEKTVQKIANLAKIKLDVGDIEKYSIQLCSILEFVGQLEESDQDTGQVSNLYDYVGEVLREDELEGGLSSKDALSNVNSSKKNNDYFAITKVL
jgi:aspartyl-tRNA(Asn)/glutamyl-tRNA(Gln) amidotransferase subunit C